MARGKGLLTYKHALRKNEMISDSLDASLDRLDSGFSFLTELSQTADTLFTKRDKRTELDEYGKKHGFRWDKDKKRYIGGEGDSFSLREGNLDAFKAYEESFGYTHPDKKFDINKYLYQPATDEDLKSGQKYGARRSVFANPGWKGPSYKPSIPVASEDEFFDEEIVIDDTDIDDGLGSMTAEEYVEHKNPKKIVKDKPKGTEWQEQSIVTKYDDGKGWQNKSVVTEYDDGTAWQDKVDTTATWQSQLDNATDSTWTNWNTKLTQGVQYGYNETYIKHIICTKR